MITRTGDSGEEIIDLGGVPDAVAEESPSEASRVDAKKPSPRKKRQKKKKKQTGGPVRRCAMQNFSGAVRFDEGTRVEIRVAPDGGGTYRSGVVVKIHYSEASMKDGDVAPYQVLLDTPHNGVLSGESFYVPADTDFYVRRATDASGGGASASVVA